MADNDDVKIKRNFIDEEERARRRRALSARAGGEIGEEYDDAGRKKRGGKNVIMTAGVEDEENDARKIPPRRRSRSYSEEEDDYEEDNRRKAPLIVRILAWVALLAIVFTLGYVVANFFFNQTDKHTGKRIGDIVGSSSDVGKRDKEDLDEKTTTSSMRYSLYVPDKDSYTKRKVEINRGRIEQDIERVLTMYFDSLKESSLMTDGVKVLNIYCSDNKLYINISAEFESSVAKLDEKQASSVITGVVKTAQENFDMKKVKFYVAGKVSKMTSPIDLGTEWELRQ